MNAVAQRSGFAVATAVFALVIVGALAIGMLFAGTHELRSGSDAIHQARAVMAAELGIEQTIAMWNVRWNAYGRGFGRASTLSTPDGARLTVNLTRLADELFLVASEARAGPARRHVARVVRLEMGDPLVLAPLAVRNAVDAIAIGDIGGSDESPLGWECPASGFALPPFAVADTNALLRFGHFDWDALIAVANTRLSNRITGAVPRSADEECDTAAPENWGEPTRSNGGPCTSYYPVLYAAGDLVVDGGRGQGLLLVDGDLTLQGGFEFFGAVLVRGALLGGAGGARVTGTVLIAELGLSESDLRGIRIALSRCAARKALLGVSRPAPLAERSWYDVFDAR